MKEQYTILDQIIDDIAELIEDGVSANNAIDKILSHHSDMDRQKMLEYFETIYLCSPAQYEENEKDDRDWEKQNGYVREELDSDLFNSDSISIEDLKDEGLNIDDDLLGET